MDSDMQLHETSGLLTMGQICTGSLQYCVRQKRHFADGSMPTPGLCNWTYSAQSVSGTYVFAWAQQADVSLA
jgi:hypothetical protein